MLFFAPAAVTRWRSDVRGWNPSPSRLKMPLCASEVLGWWFLRGRGPRIRFGGWWDGLPLRDWRDFFISRYCFSLGPRLLRR